MGERRKRKPQWDMEDEMSGVSGHNSWAGKEPYFSRDSGRYHEFSEFRTTTLKKCRDHSEHQAWESIEENPNSPTNDSFKNARGGKEMSEQERYFERMSPGFDGMELGIYNDSHDYDRSYSPRYRYPERARSRGRGRSRSRSRTRSLSKDRIIERRKGWSNNRGRSDGNSKYHSTSHSPVGDYQHRSYGWNDQSSPKKPSQVCRGFAAGRCKRGSQCIFVHPNSTSRRDNVLMENDRAENWRGKADLIRPRGSYRRGSGFESQNGVSDCYHVGGELFVNKNRRTAPCKDFVRGKCHWGDACRFSHHMNFDDGFGQGAKNAMFDKYNDRQLYKRRKPFCKYFAAGRCDRDRCRFSHDDPRLYILESDPGEGTSFCSSRDKSNRWHGRPTRDDAVNSDTLTPAAWDENIVTNNITSRSDAGNGPNDDRQHRDFDFEEKRLEISERSNSTLNSEKRPYFTGESGRYSTDTGPTEPIAEQNITNKQERLILHDSGLVNQDGTDNVQEHQVMQENRTVSSNASQQNAFPASHVQMHLFQTEDNFKNSYGPDVLGEVKETGYTSPPILLSGRSLNQSEGSIFPGHSSISSESDGAQNLPSPTQSTRFSTDLNMPPICEVDHLNSPTEMQNKQKTVQSPGPVERNTPQLIPSEQIDQLNNLVGTDGRWAYLMTTPASSTQRYGQPLTYALSDPICEVDNLNLQTEMQNKRKTVNSLGTVERNAPQLITSELSDQLNNSLLSTDGRSAYPMTTPASSTHRYEQPQTCSGSEIRKYNGIVPSFPDNSMNTTNSQENPGVVSLDLLSSMIGGYIEHDSHNFNPGTIQTTNAQEDQCPISLDLFSPVRNSRENMEHGNHNLAQGMLQTPNAHEIRGAISLDLFSPVRNSKENSEHDNHNLAQEVVQHNPMELEQYSPISPNCPIVKHPESLGAPSELTGGNKAIDGKINDVEENKPKKDEEGSDNKDEKGKRLFKKSLVEFVKELLKPTWKEGQMSRDVYKTVVKKVVDKVSGVIQGDHVPTTKDKVDQYLSYSKPKIIKLIQAYVDRCLKADRGS